MPVHKWLLRHVYYPCMRLGMGKWWAGTVVFAVSAAFHELLIGLPLHMVTFWAFIGLMCQVRSLWSSFREPDKCITLHTYGRVVGGHGGFVAVRLFQELLNGLLLRMVTTWAFIGLMCQVRLAEASNISGW